MIDKSSCLYTCNNCLYRAEPGESWPCVCCSHLGCVKDAHDYWAPGIFTASCKNCCYNDYPWKEDICGKCIDLNQWIPVTDPPESMQTHKPYILKDEPKSDPVNHPDHYTCGDIECKDAIRVAISGYTDPVDAWRAGNAMKYIWRAALKGHYLEDIKKAIFYLNEIVKEKENNNV